jgi:hypothetical protein
LDQTQWKLTASYQAEPNLYVQISSLGLAPRGEIFAALNYKENKSAAKKGLLKNRVFVGGKKVQELNLEDHYISKS